MRIDAARWLVVQLSGTSKATVPPGVITAVAAQQDAGIAIDLASQIGQQARENDAAGVAVRRIADDHTRGRAGQGRAEEIDRVRPCAPPVTNRLARLRAPDGFQREGRCVERGGIDVACAQPRQNLRAMSPRDLNQEGAGTRGGVQPFALRRQPIQDRADDGPGCVVDAVGPAGRAGQSARLVQLDDEPGAVEAGLLKLAGERGCGSGDSFGGFERG